MKNNTRIVEKTLTYGRPRETLFGVVERESEILMQQVESQYKALARRKARWNIEGLIRWDEIVQEQIMKLKKKGVKGRKPDE